MMMLLLPVLLLLLLLLLASRCVVKVVEGRCVCAWGGVGQLGGSAAGQACDKLTGIFVDKGGTTPPPLPHTSGVTLPRPLATALS